MVSQHDVQETITTVAVLEEKIKNLEVLVSKTLAWVGSIIFQ